MSDDQARALLRMVQNIAIGFVLGMVLSGLTHRAELERHDCMCCVDDTTEEPR